MINIECMITTLQLKIISLTYGKRSNSTLWYSF